MTEETLQAAEEAVIESESAPEGSEISEGEDVTEETQEAEKVEEEPKAEEQPEWLQKVIARQTYHRREAERQAEAYKAELEKVKGQLPQDAAPEIPPIPDPFDPNHDELIKERDKAVRERSTWETKQALMAEARRREGLRQQEEAQAALLRRGNTYKERAGKLGVDPSELATAGPYIASFIAPEVGDFILESEQGPLITMHLAKNPAELEKVSSMHPMMAAAYIATAIAPNIQNKPKTTSAPKPPETLGGGGAPPSEDGPPGATYE
jgi:hypothetical protein